MKVGVTNSRRDGTLLSWGQCHTMMCLIVVGHDSGLPIWNGLQYGARQQDHERGPGNPRNRHTEK